MQKPELAFKLAMYSGENDYFFEAVVVYHGTTFIRQQVLFRRYGQA